MSMGLNQFRLNTQIKLSSLLPTSKKQSFGVDPTVVTVHKVGDMGNYHVAIS